MEPLNHQRLAYEELTTRARAYFQGDWLDLPILPRWASLMVAPTGTGKTAVAAMVADAVGATMLRISSPNYMPSGANNRGTQESITVIAAHVYANPKTILVIDEIDKLIDRTGDSSWKSYIRGEIFDLLDGRWPAGLSLPDGDDDGPDPNTEALTKKLQQTVFILGIGTFQDWFDTEHTRRAMGFGAEIAPPNDEITADDIAQRVPRELANRFNSRIIRIQELRADDYHRIANEAENQLPLRMREAFRKEVTRHLPGAIASKKGVRFLEEAMLATLIQLSPKPTQENEIVKPNQEIIKNLEPCTL